MKHVMFALYSVFSLLLGFAVGCDHPTDEKLSENFKKHDAKFNELANMALTDIHMTRIAKNFLWLDSNMRWPRPEEEWGISRERWKAYNDLFNELGIDEGISKGLDFPGVIFFCVSSQGLVTGGSEKGYAYSINKPNKYDKLLPKIKIKFIKITDRWYVYYLAD